ncbi:MAG: sulfotransferase [Caldilineae bacterium]|nr:MAG: sulfotransferase [Caldilineae bacterium]
MPTFTEVLRRLYHDLVVRRSTVRVVPAESSPRLEYPPVFIIGVYRSGTTLLRYILDSHPHIACPPESDFLGGLAALLEHEPYRLGLARMGFDEAHVLARLREFSLYFFANYAASQQKPRWADKSPSYVDYLNFILQLFPEAQFVMLYRHGFDVAHSYTRGGTFMRDTLAEYCRPGEDLRLGAVRYWQDKVRRMQRFQAAEPARCFSLRYEDLCAEPEGWLRPLFAFLDEPWDARVLEFYRFPHDKGLEDGRVAATRGFSISQGHYHDWPEELRRACLAVAADTLQALGYEV